MLTNSLKSVNIWSFSGPYFPTFGLNTQIYILNLLYRLECRKIQTRKTPKTDTYPAVTYASKRDASQ